MTLIQKIQITAVLALFAACTGCGAPLTPAQQAQYDRVECEVKALAPLALTDADAVVHAIEDGKIDFADVANLTVEAKANFDAAKAAFNNCRAQFPTLSKK